MADDIVFDVKGDNLFVSPIREDQCNAPLNSKIVNAYSQDPELADIFERSINFCGSFFVNSETGAQLTTNNIASITGNQAPLQDVKPITYRLFFLGLHGMEHVGDDFYNCEPELGNKVKSIHNMTLHILGKKHKLSTFSFFVKYCKKRPPWERQGYHDTDHLGFLRFNKWPMIKSYYLSSISPHEISLIICPRHQDILGLSCKQFFSRLDRAFEPLRVQDPKQEPKPKPKQHARTAVEQAGPPKPDNIGIRPVNNLSLGKSFLVEEGRDKKYTIFQPNTKPSAWKYRFIDVNQKNCVMIYNYEGQLLQHKSRRNLSLWVEIREQGKPLRGTLVPQCPSPKSVNLRIVDKQGRDLLADLPLFGLSVRLKGTDPADPDRSVELKPVSGQGGDTYELPPDEERLSLDQDLATISKSRFSLQSEKNPGVRLFMPAEDATFDRSKRIYLMKVSRNYMKLAGLSFRIPDDENSWKTYRKCYISLVIPHARLLSRSSKLKIQLGQDDRRKLRMISPHEDPKFDSIILLKDAFTADNPAQPLKLYDDDQGKFGCPHNFLLKEEVLSALVQKDEANREIGLPKIPELRPALVFVISESYRLRTLLAKFYRERYWNGILQKIKDIVSVQQRWGQAHILVIRKSGSSSASEPGKLWNVKVGASNEEKMRKILEYIRNLQEDGQDRLPYRTILDHIKRNLGLSRTDFGRKHLDIFVFGGVDEGVQRVCLKNDPTYQLWATDQIDAKKNFVIFDVTKDVEKMDLIKDSAIGPCKFSRYSYLMLHPKYTNIQENERANKILEDIILGRPLEASR